MSTLELRHVHIQTYHGKKDPAELLLCAVTFIRGLWTANKDRMTVTSSVAVAIKTIHFQNVFLLDPITFLHRNKLRHRQPSNEIS
ncbi:hypothetical protein [Sulfitobacter sp. M368]|uniref:hypothetical protein n=1 Tax=Sulfitobacter sp. M368 TaxID=2867021 RepID=UPI0021A4E48B|nr:hypothetical protein [Sulfitobacter sp. M368]UWR15869.1 hypothetical protein K3754_02890 [Sulfitobacter sp. M368]